MLYDVFLPVFIPSHLPTLSVSQPHSHVTVMVDQFITQNSARFLSALFHLDEQKKRVLSSDDIIKVLIDLGLNMTQVRHLTLIFKEIITCRFLYMRC